jgi:hypothetical protein
LTATFFTTQNNSSFTAPNRIRHNSPSVQVSTTASGLLLLELNSKKPFRSLPRECHTSNSLALRATRLRPQEFMGQIHFL